MRKILALVGVTAVTGAATFLAGSLSPAIGQGGGTVEVDVKYNGAPVVEKLEVNKDTHRCGTEAVIEKVKVGGNKGLANAVASVPAAKGQELARPSSSRRAARSSPASS